MVWDLLGSIRSIGIVGIFWIVWDLLGSFIFSGTVWDLLDR